MSNDYLCIQIDDILFQLSHVYYKLRLVWNFMFPFVISWLTDKRFVVNSGAQTIFTIHVQIDPRLMHIKICLVDNYNSCTSLELLVNNHSSFTVFTHKWRLASERTINKCFIKCFGYHSFSSQRSEICSDNVHLFVLKTPPF